MIHHVYANRLNIGDWLAARGIQSLLAGHAIVEHFCDEPFVADTLDALAECTADDLIVIGGGGLFMDYFVPFWEGIQRLSPKLNYGIWGVGYCDLKQENSRPCPKLLQAVVDRSAFCYVRDELSRQYLSECRLPPAVPCPSLVAVESNGESGHGLLHVDNYTTAGADVFAAMQDYGEQFAEQTGRPFRGTNNRLDSANEASFAAILRLYDSSDMVLSSALHGCLVALALGKKLLAVSGDRKIESCLENLGFGKWILDVAEVHDLPRRLRELETQTPPQSEVAMARIENQKVAKHILKTMATQRSEECAVVRSHRDTTI